MEISEKDLKFDFMAFPPAPEDFQLLLSWNTECLVHFKNLIILTNFNWIKLILFLIYSPFPLLSNYYKKICELMHIFFEIKIEIEIKGIFKATTLKQKILKYKEIISINLHLK